ncbi:hypothetical protein A5738_03435 [Mycobacterium colombiense]|nr:hypothetical protein A5738_03435 [Mycobacterium colombiense]
MATRLRNAQPLWQQMNTGGRARWLGKWRDWMLDHRDDLLTPLQLETGKSWCDYPYSRKKGSLVEKMVWMLSAKDWRRRLGR